MLTRTVANSSMLPNTPSARPEIASLLGAFGVCSLFATACVSRDVGTGERELPCSIERSNGAPEDSVVLLQVPVANTFLTKCSGVAIARSLVVTQLKCVLGRSEPAGFAGYADAGPPLPFSALADRSGSSNYTTQCQQDAGWVPIEDGDFSARLGEALDPSVINVSPVVIGPEMLGVPAAEVFAMRATSVCGDDLAIVALGAELDVVPLPIRFGLTRLGQAIQLSGFCRDEASGFTRQSALSSVGAIAGNQPTTDAPSRSLSTAGSVAATFSGGAAIDTQTGALIGIISSGSNIGNCQDQDPDGTTVVFLLAPYRRLLLDAADAVGASLYAEHQPEIAVRPCAEP